MICVFNKHSEIGSRIEDYYFFDAEDVIVIVKYKNQSTVYERVVTICENNNIVAKSILRIRRDTNIGEEHRIESRIIPPKYEKFEKGALLHIGDIY